MDWNLVNYIAPPSKFNSSIKSRVLELSKTVNIVMEKLSKATKAKKRSKKYSIYYENISCIFNREHRTAEIIIKGPTEKEVISLSEALEKEVIGGL